MKEVTLSDVLAAREARAERQRRFLLRYGVPLVSFSMNIAGPVKDTPAVRRAFRYGQAALNRALTAKGVSILAEQETLAVTGCEAVYATEADPLALKALCVAIEDGIPIGRLFDMDVIGTDGIKVDRAAVGKGERGCIVCGRPGRECASRRLHPVEALQGATARLIEAHFEELDASVTADAVTEALLQEVYTTPKPGLVDRSNNGSHRDMTVATFAASAAALHPYWAACVRTGIETRAVPAAETFRKLRQLGMQAERDMLAATGGVNTHKGAIFLLGVLCGAIGRRWTAGAPFAPVETLCAESAAMTADVLAEEWERLKADPPEHTTNGQRLYLQYGVTGARGEAAGGFKTVLSFGLPIYRKALQSGLSENDAAAVALLHLLANGADTNMIARGGVEKAGRAREAVQRLLQKTPFPDPKETEALDSTFIAQNLSPGGSADLLAVTLFLAAIAAKNE